MSDDRPVVGSQNRSRYGMLAASLPMLAAMYPVLGWGQWGHFAWTAVFWFVLLGCFRVVTGLPAVRVIASILGLVAIVASVASLWCFNSSDSGHGRTYLVIHGVSFAFLLFTLGATLADVLTHTRVRTQTLMGAACGYVLLGLTFALLMLVLHSVGVEPAARALVGVPEVDGMPELGRYLYFSFVTLSTLGFGDVVPHTLVGQVLAPAEAVIGQLYLAVFIARLIGMYVADDRPCPRCGRDVAEE